MTKTETGILTLDWFGNLMEKSPVKFSLTVDSDKLVFSADQGPGSSPLAGSQPREFTPNLWQADVAELFLRSSDDCYLEINLASHGAWWAAWFSSPRVQNSTLPLPTAHISSNGDMTQLILALDQLSPLGPVEHWHWNVTAICGGETQRFFSQAKLPGDEPDFHQPAHFLPWSTS